LNLVHYFAGASAGRDHGPAGTAVDKARRANTGGKHVSIISKPGTGKIFETPSAVAAAVTALPRADSPPLSPSTAAQPYERAYSPIVLAGTVRLIEFALVGLVGLIVYFSYVVPRTASPGTTSPPFSASSCSPCWRSKSPTSIRSRPSAGLKSNTCGSPRPGRSCF
jgi:hypothetical protein